MLHYSWQVFGDCGHLNNDNNIPLNEYFNLPCDKGCVFNSDLPHGLTENNHCKYTIRKTHKPAMLSIHTAVVNNGVCYNMEGELVDCRSPFGKIIWKNAYVKHFLTQDTKTFKERRFNKLDACGNLAATNDKLIERYFNLNKRTKEKEELFYAK